ncbi:hypothetical protein Hanom_Chr01g00002041 [Helianthus anomalus]
MTVAPTCLKCRSSRIRLNQIAWQVAAVAAMYSASVLDNATVPCFLVLHVIAALPRENTLAEMLFRSSIQPPQSLSE